jgi:hypothetical protein
LPLSLITQPSISAAFSSQSCAARRRMAERSVCGRAAKAGCASIARLTARVTWAGVAMPTRPSSWPVAGPERGHATVQEAPQACGLELGRDGMRDFTETHVMAVPAE